MGSSVHKFFAAVTTAAILAGCGTTHHVLPAAPLERGHYQISLTWHYDLNGFYAPRGLLWPDLNAYIGLGREYNLGFGGNIPCFVNHISLARYYRVHDHDYWSSYLHINRVFAANSNPLWEIGATYGSKSSGCWRTFSMGLAYGQIGVIDRGFLLMILPNTVAHRIMPTFKGSLVGRDVGVSWDHYAGQTTALLASLKDRILHHNDTLLRFGPGQVSSIDYTNDDWESTIRLNLTGDSSVTIWGIEAYADRWPDQLDDFQRWLGKFYRICLKADGNLELRIRTGDLILAPSEIEADIAAGRPVTVTRYPMSLLTRLESYGNILRDNSFGIGAIFNQD